MKEKKILKSMILAESLDLSFAVTVPLQCIYNEQLLNKTNNAPAKGFTGMIQNHRSSLSVISDNRKDGSAKEPS